MSRLLHAMLLLLSACAVEPPCPPATLAPLDEPPAYALVASDYQSTAVAMLRDDGTVITEAWVDSGTTEPRLVTALTGDVSLPTDPWPGELVLLDRFGVDAITRIALPTGEVLGQHPTRTVERGAYRPNPHDAIRLDDGHALVSRFEPNLDAAAPALDRGDDLVVLDLSADRVTARIDLTPMEVANGDDPIWARPDRMTRRGAYIVVGLARLSSNWQAGPGAVVVVDEVSRTAREVPLPDLRVCGTVRPVVGDDAAAIVLCSGDPFEEGGALRASDEARRRLHAGIAVVRVSASGAATVEHLWRAADHSDAPVPTSSLVSLGGSRLVYTGMGDDRTGRPDRVVVLDVADESVRPLFEAAPYAIGAGQFDPLREMLLLPDAESGVRRLRDGAGELPAVDAFPCRHLPARELSAMVRHGST